MKVESLNQELKEAKASYLKITQEPKEQNSNTANEIQKLEPMEAKDTGGREKIEKEDSLPSTAISVQEPLKGKDTEGQEKTEKEDLPALSVQIPVL